MHTGDTISLYTALTPKLGRGGSKVLLGQSFIGGAIHLLPAGLTNLIKAPHRGPTHCSKFLPQVFLLQTYIFLDKLPLSVQHISHLDPHSAKHLTVHFELMQLIGLASLLAASSLSTGGRGKTLRMHFNKPTMQRQY